MSIMNVKQLIAELKKFDPKSEVLLSIDEEGNGFNSLDEVQLGAGYSAEFGKHIILWPGGTIEPDEEN